MSTKAEKLEYTSDKMEEYSRRNSILTHGLPEVNREDTDTLIIEMMKEKIGLDNFSADIGRTHGLGAPPTVR